MNWKFPRIFWTSNFAELFERAAYYALFITITLYLTQVVGFNDIWAAWISGGFSAGLYFLPTISGAVADRIGFRRAIMLAFSLLTIGYFSLGAFPYKSIVIPSLFVTMCGAALIKPVLSGTVAKATNKENRARAYSIFYGIVNIGSFLGKTFAYPLRIKLGLEAINFFSAAMTLIALILVFFLYRNIEVSTAEVKKFREIFRGMWKLITNPRLILLIIIITGFWIIQYQLYATMPKYVLRTVGKTAAPEWIANVNPFIVMTCVVLITHLMSKVKAITSITVGMFIMPVSALCMASSPLLQSITGDKVPILGLFTAHPITIMMIIGIIFQGLAECFISPRYLEFFSLQAPKGEEGVYLGFSYFHSFIASLTGFAISGYLLTAYAPDPTTLTSEQLKTAYDHAYYIWYYFAAIGLTAAIALVAYNSFFSYKDKQKEKL
ncbi:MAG: MFS transporter [Bacteroidota bacterium]|nr:MFS transporter [Bacteroidota bacterium]MDP4191217.1 MFS transporter [Bacteroidota bacterium]MDP4195618.1 MFS transporter [Bacteroidota bacterium]